MDVHFDGHDVVAFCLKILYDVVPDMNDYVFTMTGDYSAFSTHEPVPKLQADQFKRNILFILNFFAIINKSK
jgi:hypothetical protein